MNKIFRASILLLIFIFIQTALYSCDSIIQTNENITHNTDNTDNTENIENVMAVGGPGEGCRHSNTYQNSYHSISTTLINHVGKTNFSNWVEKVRADKEKYIDTDCHGEYCNIVRFVKDFNIPKENFQAILDNSGMNYYAFDYNLDIIYSGDEKLIDEYYCSGKEREKEYLIKECLYGIKIDLSAYIKIEFPDEFNKWVSEMNSLKIQAYTQMDKKPLLLYSKMIDDSLVDTYSNEFTGNLRQWSIPEFIAQFNIPCEKFIEILERNTINRESIDQLTAVEFDIDLLYYKFVPQFINQDVTAETLFADSAEIDLQFVKINENKLAAVHEAIKNDLDAHIADGQVFEEDNLANAAPIVSMP